MKIRRFRYGNYKKSKTNVPSIKQVPVIAFQRVYSLLFLIRNITICQYNANYSCQAVFDKWLYVLNIVFIIVSTLYISSWFEKVALNLVHNWIVIIMSYFLHVCHRFLTCHYQDISHSFLRCDSIKL
jgi:hypothetical protein